MSNITQLSKKCPTCGKEFYGKETYCGRCRILQCLLGAEPNAENLAAAFWDHCFACEEEIIATINLTPENLVIQCDACGEVHVIPFEEEDLQRYVRSGIIREMVADE